MIAIIHASPAIAYFIRTERQSKITDLARRRSRLRSRLRDDINLSTMISARSLLCRCTVSSGSALSSSGSRKARAAPIYRAVPSNIGWGSLSPSSPSHRAQHTNRSIVFSSRILALSPRTPNVLSSSHCGRPRAYLFSTFAKESYVHPLSQIVLEHLQSRHGSWVKGMGLDTGLKLNEDGTFVLRFRDTISASAVDLAEEDVEGNETGVNGSIW